MRYLLAVLVSTVLFAFAVAGAHRCSARRAEADQSLRRDAKSRRHPLRPSHRVAVAAPFQATGPLGRLFAWVLDQQQKLQRVLATSVKSLKTDNPIAGAFTLADSLSSTASCMPWGPGTARPSSRPTSSPTRKRPGAA